MSDLNTFIGISRLIGANPLWVQGPGGNVSVKGSDGIMIVKGSGSELADVDINKGYSLVNYIEFLKSLETLMFRNINNMEREVRYSDLVSSANTDSIKYPRPSMELGFHALFPGKYVIHYHSVASIAASFLYSTGVPLPAFDSSIKAYFEPFHLPGFSICPSIKKIADKISSDEQTSVVFLANHGVIISTTEDPFNVIEILSAWENIFWEEFFHEDYSSYTRNHLYSEAATFPVTLRPLFPDFVMLENRIKDSVVAVDNTVVLKSELTDTAAADLFAVYSLLVRKVLGITSLSDAAVSNIRNMPIEMARVKLMMKGG
jgi:rhamnose utilization protein RhaD (predicted bifunctional aldolase and dehydrogenase)